MRNRNFFTLEKLLRMVADTLMLNFALIFAAMVAGVLVSLDNLGSQTVTPATLSRYYASVYFAYAWLITVIGIPLFYLHGFYTRGRYYRGRYKILCVTQGVSSVYGLAFVIIFAGNVMLNRAVVTAWMIAWLIAGWALTCILLVTARLWSTVWMKLMVYEIGAKLEPDPERPVKRVLVIGGAGYIGSSFVEKLLAQGYQVRLLDILMYGVGPIQTLLEHKNLEIVQTDFRQIDKLVETMRDMDAVVHLGGLVGDPACAYDEKLTIDINLIATRTIAEIAKGYNIKRFIFASTCSVYGASHEMLTEKSFLNPVSLYARSKIASERVLQKIADHTFAPTILRFGTIYGLSGRTRFDLVVNLLVAKAITEKKITVYGGDQWRPFVHVDDAALALMKALEAPITVAGNRIYNVGSNEQNYQIKTIAHLIQSALPTADIVSLSDDVDKRDYRVDFSRIRRELQFEPRWTVEAGIREVAEAFESGKVVDYRDSQYSNVQVLSEEGATLLEGTWASGWADELLQSSALGNGSTHAEDLVELMDG